MMMRRERLKFQVDDEFTSICQQIQAANRDTHEWAEIESADMFQTEKFFGGYDSDESGFRL